MKRTVSSSTWWGSNTKIVWTRFRLSYRPKLPSTTKKSKNWSSSAPGPSSSKNKRWLSCTGWTPSNSKPCTRESCKLSAPSTSRSMTRWGWCFNSSRRWIRWLRRSARVRGILTLWCTSWARSKRGNCRSERRICWEGIRRSRINDAQ